MTSLTGRLLVASPHLADPNFVRTVALMVQHGEQGALGLVLNRPIEKTVQDLWREVGGGPCRCHDSVFFGGPVPGPLMAVHCNPALAELEIMPGLFFAAAKQNLDALVADGGSPFKIFVGHSGWGPGQLDGELAEGAWLTTTAAAEFVFGGEENLWQSASKKIGRQWLEESLHIRDFPDDPSVN